MPTKKILVGALYSCTNFIAPSIQKMVPSNAFYLTPLPNPKEDVWYSRTSLGHNSLSEVMSELVLRGTSLIIL